MQFNAATLGLAAAVSLASAVEFMQLHVDHMPGWEGTCEIRAFAVPGADGACRGVEVLEAVAS